MLTEVTAVINLNALRHNFKRVQAEVAGSKIIAMVKRGKGQAAKARV